MSSRNYTEKRLGIDESARMGEHRLHHMLFDIRCTKDHPLSQPLERRNQWLIR
jgi:hypothetical protein